jgi:hypothetical protein
MKNIILIIISTLIILGLSSCRKSPYLIDEVIILKDTGTGIGTTTLTADKEYLIDGLVFVNDGQVLSIEPGTVIRAKPGQGENASALIVCRGGKINACGTAAEPIVFTAESDDLNGSIPLETSGLWGGIIILGNAPVNIENGEAKIEGIPVYDERADYGGTDPNDDSGTFCYVSIRHSGTSLSAGNEINGLTLGGVGNKTDIHHIEVVSNSDDGVEFFGGTVNCKYMISAFCGDDAFDFDDGYVGYGQYWLAIQTNSAGDLLSEHDGGADFYNNYTKPTIYNATFIGRGITGSKGLISFRNGSGGIYKNSVFINQAWGVKIQYEGTNYDSYTKFKTNGLVFENNIFYYLGIPDYTGVMNLVSETLTVPLDKQTEINEYFINAGNVLKDPGIAIEADHIIVLPTGEINGQVSETSDNWFDNAEYKGAFKNVNWALGWSYLSKTSYLR